MLGGQPTAPTHDHFLRVSVLTVSLLISLLLVLLSSSEGCSLVLRLTHQAGDKLASIQVDRSNLPVPLVVLVLLVVVLSRYSRLR